jgi:hypothetical protein
MNIIKLQDELRGVPDNALIGYVQNPTGHVPSYLALSELQRRKDMRSKYESQQAPESSVADDLEQEATPQPQPQLQEAQGVAGLPIPDQMFNSQGMAAGGIVAFDDGGEVPSFAGPSGSAVYAPNYEGTAKSAIGRGIDYLTGGLQGYGEKKSKLMELQKQIETLQPNMFEALTPSELSTRKAQVEELKAQQEAIRNPSSGYVYKEGEKATDPTMKSYVDQEVAAKNNPFKPPSDKKEFKYGDKPVDTKPAATQAATQAAKQVTQQPAESEEDFLRKRMAIYKEYMGGDEDKKGLKDKLDKMEARAARQEELAPYMAITEAGFKTMQGTSPYALANFGAGAEAGIKSYGSAQDKMAALEEKRYALMNDAAKADRAERQAAITFGENSYQHKAAMDQKDRIANMSAALKEKEIGLGYAKINSDSNLIKSANFGLKEQAAIDKYVKTAMGTDSLILENLRKLDPAKLDDKKKALLKTYSDKEARVMKEAMQKYNINNLVNKARPGLADTTFKSSDYTVEELPGL